MLQYFVNERYHHSTSRMDLSDLSTATPKALNRCLALFEKSSTTPASVPASTPAKYASNPHVQFFSTVKAKNHYAYHKSKRDFGKAAASRTLHRRRQSEFKPFSREQLLLRLRSFTALNWSIPYMGSQEHPVTELLCAANGWKCMPVSRSQMSFNQLMCTSCCSRLTLKFNSDSTLDESDIWQINRNLAVAYKKHIEESGHSDRCPWRDFSAPDSTYYLVPHLSLTNETLLGDYLALVLKTFNNIDKLKPFADDLKQLADVGPDSKIKPISSQWLLARFFKDTKENMASVLESKLPLWAYQLAAMGWDIELQTAAPAVLLSCPSCNERVLLWQNQKTDLSHKSWCLHSKDIDEKQFVDYFVKMLLSSGPNIGPGGKYIAYNDIVKPDGPLASKPMDLEEGLERFTKLRKLYFAES